MSAGVAWVFPGQGSQAIGMGQAVAEADVDARAAFDEADAALGFPISRICWDGPEDALTRTSNQQPAIVTTSVATLRALHAESLLPEPDYVAGHSLGEYSALVAADAVGAGPGEVVLIAAGSSARQTVATDKRPVDAVIMAIVDSWDVGGDVKYRK